MTKPKKLQRYHLAIEALKDEFFRDRIQNLVNDIVLELKQHDLISYRRVIKSGDMLLEIKRRPPGANPYCVLHLGYPKPVYTEELRIQWKGFGVSFSLTGSSFWKLQNEYLEDLLNCSITKIDDYKYQTLIEALLLRKFERLAYADPFNNIGDSYISARIWRPLGRFVSSEAFMIFTQNELLRGVSPFSACQDLLAWLKEAQQQTLTVYPIIFDQHWDQAESICTEVAGTKQHSFWAPGRKILCVDSRIYACVADSLDHNKNIEEGLRQITPFAQPYYGESKAAPSSISSYEVLVSPFGSGVTKYIPYPIVSHFSREADSRVIILLHHLDDLENQRLTEAVAASETVRFQQASLLELSALVESCSGVIAADSGVAHIANFYNLPCVVFYNTDRSDRSSYVSLIYHSVLGYGSKNINFLPILFSSKSLANKDVPLDYQTLASLAVKYLSWLQSRSWSKSEKIHSRQYLRTGQSDRSKKAAAIFMRGLGLSTDEQTLLLASYYDAFPQSLLQHHVQNIPHIGTLYWELSPLRKVALHILNSDND